MIESINHPEIHALLELDPENVTTLVDVGVEIEGVIRNKATRALLISGRVIGTIESDGPVIINQGAEVLGSIKATSMQLAGRVTRRDGNDILDISGALVVAKTGHMGCDAKCAGVQLEFGATIDGSIQPRKRVEAIPVSEPIKTPPLQVQNTYESYNQHAEMGD